MKVTLKFTLIMWSLLLFVPAASARMKVDSVELAKVESIAIVGYSFFRNVEMEPASPFKLKPQVIELTPLDPEYLMMRDALGSIVEVIQRTEAFQVLPQEDVFSNASYQSLSKDPKKRLALNWYFPNEFRDLKKNKSNATKLAEALNVDAVLWVHFKHGGSSTSTNTLGVFGKKKEYVLLKGEVSLFDKSGNSLISGSVKSKKMLKYTRRSIGAVGDYASGIEIETQNKVIAADDLWFPLLESYLEALENELMK